MNDDFRWLDEAILSSLAHTAIRMRLSREALLGGLSSKLRAQIHTRETLAQQVLEDLRFLNGIEALGGGDVPLRSWLRTAAHLTDPRPDAAVFREALGHIARRGLPAGDAVTARPVMGPIWSAGSVTEVWQHPDAAAIVQIMSNYGSPRVLRGVALGAGFDASRVHWEQEIAQVSRELVTESYKAMKLEAILEAMRADVNLRISHDALEAILRRDA